MEGLNVPPCVQEFIRQERLRLNNPVYVSEEWLKRNTGIVLRYYYHILKYFHEIELGKKFRLAPLCQMKCHFLTIDNTVLLEIL